MKGLLEEPAPNCLEVMDSNVQYAENDGDGSFVEIINGIHRRYVRNINGDGVDVVEIEDVGHDESDTCEPGDESQVEDVGLMHCNRTGTGTDDDNNVCVVEEFNEEGEMILRYLPDQDGEGTEEKEENEVIPPPLVRPVKFQRFSSGGDFLEQMNIYAYSSGFTITIKEPVKDKKDMIFNGPAQDVDDLFTFDLVRKYKNHRKLRLQCSKAGVPKSRSSDPNISTTSRKTMCPWKVNTCRSPSSGTSWKITMLNDKHNHELDPKLSRLLCKYRRMSVGDQTKALELHRGGIGICKIYDLFVSRYDGIDKVPFLEWDLRNFLNFSAGERLKGSDFVKMETYFKKMSLECHGCFYEFEIDDQNQLKSVFWADARCRAAFKVVGDTVSFDTTFLCNRYKYPFAPFSGADHNGNTILLECALLSTEHEASFARLFQTFKKCMGKQPDNILTDQDVKIGNAIQSEFPGIRHRWCLWHVKQNARKHLGMLPQWGEISDKLQEILHDTFSVEEFECEWQSWVKDFGVGGNGWVQRAYADRERWVPVYFKSIFWAGMSSTQRSEGMNMYLKLFVNVNTSLGKFAEEYGKAVNKRVFEEVRCSKIGKDWSSRKTSNHPFQAAFEKMYSRNQFLKMQEQMKDMRHNAATIEKVTDDTVIEYKVVVKTFRKGWTKRKYFRVVIDRSTVDVKCECQLFEFTGIICCHMLRVFWEEDIGTVPVAYICERWRKDVVREYKSMSYPMESIRPPVSSEVKRYNEMQKVSESISAIVMYDEVRHRETLEKLNVIHSELKQSMANVEGDASFRVGSVGSRYRAAAKAREAQDLDKERPVDVEPSLPQVKDPIDKRGMGRGAAKRKLSFAEKKKRQWRNRKRGAGKETNASTPNTPLKYVESAFCRQWQPTGLAGWKPGVTVTGSAKIPVAANPFTQT